MTDRCSIEDSALDQTKGQELKQEYNSFKDNVTGIEESVVDEGVHVSSGERLTCLVEVLQLG